MRDILNMNQVALTTRRALRAFSDDQMTHHAAAITYFALMSLFPTLLVAVSLLGLVGQYPETYDAILQYLRSVAPAALVVPVDASLRETLQNKETAATAFAVSAVLALYGATAALEACRRAMNLVFEVETGRSFLRRKAVDVVSAIVLMALALTTVVLVFVGGQFAEDLLGFIGLGSTAADVWSVVRWPFAIALGMLGFATTYYVTPDVKHRSFRWITPGAVVGVLLWLVASFGFSTYLTNVPAIGAVYGAFFGAIVLVVWLWMTSIALLFGAELDAEIERQKELHEGVPADETLNLPPKR